MTDIPVEAPTITGYLSLVGCEPCEKVTILGGDLFPTVPRVPVRCEDGHVVAVNNKFVHKTWHAARDHLAEQLRGRIQKGQAALFKDTEDLYLVLTMEAPPNE